MTMKPDESLTRMADAIRECLGLDPIPRPHVIPKARETVETRFYVTYPWNDSNGIVKRKRALS